VLGDLGKSPQHISPPRPSGGSEIKGPCSQFLEAWARHAEMPTPRNRSPYEDWCQPQGLEWTEAALTHRTAESSPHPSSPNIVSAPLGSEAPGALIRRHLPTLAVGCHIHVRPGTVVAAAACGPLSCIFPWAAFPPVPAPDFPPLRHRPCHVSSMRCRCAA
jgi:hypothetical protein